MNKTVYVEVMDGGKLPSKAHINDAGFDVYATSDISVYPGEVHKHPLRIKLGLPVGCYASIESKSGLGSRGLLVYAGVIDEGYRGEVHAVFSNIKLTVDGKLNNEPIIIKKGEKLAQVIVYPFDSYRYTIEQIHSVEELGDTFRGSGGFGSSGL